MNPIEFKAVRSKAGDKCIIITGNPTPLIISVDPKMPLSAMDVIVNNLNNIFDYPRRWSDYVNNESESNTVALTQELTIKIPNLPSNATPWQWKSEWCILNGKPATQKWAWNAAEKAYRAHFGEMSYADTKPTQNDATGASEAQELTHAEAGRLLWEQSQLPSDDEGLQSNSAQQLIQEGAILQCAQADGYCEACKSFHVINADGSFRDESYGPGW